MRGQPARLLLVGAVREQRRADEVDADAADELRRARPRELLGDDVVLDRARAAAAVLLAASATPTQPAARELRLPRAPERDLVGEVVEARRQALAVLPRAGSRAATRGTRRAVRLRRASRAGPWRAER